MRIINLVITVCVGAVMLIGAGMTYHYRMQERKLDPPGTVYVRDYRASLPKWDDKNWKGLTYHEAGYYKKKAEAAKQDKQNAAK